MGLPYPSRNRLYAVAINPTTRTVSFGRDYRQRSYTDPSLASLLRLMHALRGRQLQVSGEWLYWDGRRDFPVKT